MAFDHDPIATAPPLALIIHGMDRLGSRADFVIFASVSDLAFVGGARRLADGRVGGRRFHGPGCLGMAGSGR